MLYTAQPLQRIMSRKNLTILFLMLAPVFGLQLVQAQEPVQTSDANASALFHHSLKVRLDPANQSITVEDTITLSSSADPAQLQFSLNSNLSITNNPRNLQKLASNRPSAITGINEGASLAAPVDQYSLRLRRRDGRQFSLVYSGIINDVAEQNSAEYAQSFSETNGIIGEQGVYLAKASAWIPDFGNDFLSFDLQVEFASNADSWTAVSQGDRAGKNGWSSQQPMEEVYLIAADFTEYSQQADDVEVLAYLRQPDPNLAAKYLDATERYLALYEPLLGEYPYSKFALIENFWETGYGMPSFTLLGEQVIRFPFILESSYPHEILHNWWGNSVYPDYDSGNWSEGLTAYLADHLFQEMEGLGADYRKEMLARYKNYVADGTDFPLSQFTSRNSAASQAIGYGKTLMLWHMLRVELGDELFLQGLRKLYQDYKYRRVSFTDIAILYSVLSGTDLRPFFSQWVDRTGAPALSITVEEANANRARIMFAQIQNDDPYELTVPVALYYAGEAEPQVFDVSLSQKLEGVMADDYDRLQAVVVDPYFDVFRQLDRAETPPTIGELFGSSKIAFVLPAIDRQHWAQMAESFGQGSDAEIFYADQLESLPDDRSIWILGRDNPFSATVIAATEHYGTDYSDTDYSGTRLSIAGSDIPFEDRSTVLVTRHPDDPELALGWIHVDDMIAMPGMIEKLPHYGKYSYLSFLGDEPSNDVKGVWSSPDSPLQWVNAELSSPPNLDLLPTNEPIAILPRKYMPDQLMRHVTQLSAADMEGRGLGSAGLDRAALYVADQFRQSGLQTLTGTYIHRWTEGVAGQGSIELANVIGMIPGSNRQLSDEPVILAAHFDHLGIDGASGQAFPGADDNASGISVLIETAARLASTFVPQRPILFVAFSGEESGLLGSRHFVQNPPRGFETENLFAMISLDAVGRLEGRELQVFATDSAYEWPFMAQGIGFTIGVTSSFPQQTIASSDHVSFLNEGIPALHLFSGVHEDYHRVSDTADKIDAIGMSDVALWVEEAIVYLADRVEPLRVNLAGAKLEVQSATGGNAREASLGTVPDFAYSGEGVRISGVSPNSAAALAGLEAGDILLDFNGESIDDLQGYSNLLRQSAPGDAVTIGVRRGQQSFTVEAILKSR